MSRFPKMLADGRVHLFDGGYGTLLQARGLPAGMSPEAFGLKNPAAVRGIHEEYLAAGAEVLTTNTFGGSRPKLGPGDDVTGLNRAMAELARAVAGDRCCVAGSVGPTGLFVEPLGPLTLQELVAIFREQIRGLVAGGVDLILAETHFDLAEARAVVLAAREITSLPVAVSMTFESGRSLTGTAPLSFIDAMQNMGVELVGTNCSLGPAELVGVVRAMRPRLSTPLLVQPNAGLPELGPDGRTTFRLAPAEFAERSLAFAAEGAKFLGGCCGTTPAHIRALRQALGERSWQRPSPGDRAASVLVSRSHSVPLGGDHPCALIGERINPTGKKTLTAELQAGVFDEALRLAAEQVAAGADALDVNVGAPLVREEDALPELARLLAARVELPLVLDSTNPQAIEKALWVSPGSPLVNSISGEPGRMELLGPLCKRFGAPFILLPIRGKEIPFEPRERIACIEALLKAAEDLGVPRRLAVVDALVLTVSSKPLAAQYCLETIAWCRGQGLAVVAGLSNVSFGLPARELVNSAFLSMAQAAGMSGCIVNPGSARIRESLFAGEVLLGRDPQASRFIAAYAGWTPAAGGAAGQAGAKAGPKAGAVETLRQAVVVGAKEAILPLLDAALAQGRDPESLVNDELIPGILEVGERYERREYFLPQLLLCAETMQTAFERVKPLLEKAGKGLERPRIVMATVEGDVHDIGKNIVTLMLKNHGFEVVDLGKDVEARRIVDEAAACGARLVGLSALMTTTMVRMQDTVRLIRERGLPIKVMVGGAVLSEAYASSIGADGYARDAVAAVNLAKRLVG